MIVPLVALLATTGLLAPEIDDGSISYLLAKPISRHTIVAQQARSSPAAACWCSAPCPMLVRRPGAGPSARRRSALGFALGALAGGLAYCALFALLSVLTRHAVVIGLRLPADLGGPARRAARRRPLAQHHPLGRRDHRPGRRPQPGDDLGLTYAVVAVVVVIVAGTWLTGSRLRGFNLTGDE